ncbi:unnamed protein product [Mesocestoides corti]|uniref:Uncharacterized protein n=1 Tax=Mesocestoides corti TaxID=53468 RepID=A0A0R3U9N0_MESCO|nr:unnamed protein product [Mesocestoides corti]
MQSQNCSYVNQKSEDRVGLEDGYQNRQIANSYLRNQQTSSRRLGQQGSTAITTCRDDSDFTIHNSAAQIPIMDRLEAAAQSAVSFESTQSHRPPSYARNCLDVEPVQRAISEPPASFLAAVRQA